MTRENSISAQLTRAEKLLVEIEDEYNKSLHEKNVSENLKLNIQSFCGHLRSSLDYLANDLVEKYCATKNKSYFPITDNDTAFSIRMNKDFSDLLKNNSNIYYYLESIQPYKKTENKWLAQFNKINNEHKHNDLVEQTRTEVKTVNVTGQNGGSVSWGPGVTFGSGVSVMGVQIDPITQLPVNNNTVKTEVITWVDFKFEGIDASALSLLKEALQKIKLVHTTVRNFF